MYSPVTVAGILFLVQLSTLLFQIYGFPQISLFCSIERAPRSLAAPPDSALATFFYQNRTEQNRIYTSQQKLLKRSDTETATTIVKSHRRYTKHEIQKKKLSPGCSSNQTTPRGM